MAKSTAAITIQRVGATQQKADDKLTETKKLYVIGRVPDVRQVRPPVMAGSGMQFSPYDFFVRDEATGVILLNNKGEERIRDTALQNAFEALIDAHIAEVIDGVIDAEENAKIAAAKATRKAAERAKE